MWWLEKTYILPYDNNYENLLNTIVEVLTFFDFISQTQFAKNVLQKVYSSIF